QYANIRVDKETPADILRDANSCFEAAELVPAATVYDWLRNEYLANAAELGCLAASAEAGNAGYRARPRLGVTALSFARTYLDVDPKDATGRDHVALARGLAFSGRYGEAVDAGTAAITLAREAWQGDLLFFYRYASL